MARLARFRPDLFAAGGTLSDTRSRESELREIGERPRFKAFVKLVILAVSAVLAWVLVYGLYKIVEWIGTIALGLLGGAAVAWAGVTIIEAALLRWAL